VTHHVKHPWRLETDGKTFYFCDDPDCEIVYFSNDDSVIAKSVLRTQVGIKTRLPEAMLCYCYGVTLADFNEEPSIKDYIIKQTKLGLCSCESTNPSGKCCLKNFPQL
jgi:hypothetical protein